MQVFVLTDRQASLWTYALLRIIDYTYRNYFLTVKRRVNTMSKIKTLLLGVGISFAASFSFNAAAADGEALYTAKNCQTCHGVEGKAPIMAMYPKLNGQNKEYLVAQMKDIKSGARNNGMSMAMKAMTMSVTDEEFEAIADYLSKVK